MYFKKFAILYTKLKVTKLFIETMSEIEVFKSSILRIRDILRGPGINITGMDSFRHICMYIMARYMTHERVIRVGMPENLAWEEIMNLSRQNGGLHTSLDVFNNPYLSEQERLTGHFDRLFGTDKFPFDIKHPKKHNEILEILDKINLDVVNDKMDALGWIYEQHIKTGSNGSGMRDLGQYFTNRDICDYMVTLCEPKFKALGVPESICDPTMGTGGFLTSYLKYFREHYTETPIAWATHINKLNGCDTDTRVAGVARMNTFMETGGYRSENLLHRDSLYSDCNSEASRAGYDLILANMPFGVKGIKYAECCNRVKQLGISGTKAEPLFLQLIMLSLNPGGRSAVIVPDNVLTSISKIHTETRKYLIENFELKRVIKMRGQFFISTGIQPSILFFENSEFSTGDIEFMEISYDRDNNIIETLITTCHIDDLDTNLTLNPYQIKQNMMIIPINDFPNAKLSDILNIVSGKANTDRSDQFEIPYYDSNGIIGHVSDPLYTGEYVITARNLSIGAVHYVNGSFFPSDHTINFTTKDSEKLITKFFYYWLLLNNQILKNLASGVKPGIRKSDVENIIMPIPPIDIQKRTVKILDEIYETHNSNQKLIMSSQQQIKTLIHSIDTHEYNIVMINELYDIPKNIKKFNSGDKSGTGDTPFFNGKWNCPDGMHSEHSFDSPNEYFVVILGGGGDHTSDKVGLGKCFNISGKCAIMSCNTILTQKIINPIQHKYVHCWMRAKIEKLRSTARRSINLEHISINDLMSFKINLPPLEMQKQVIKMTNNLDNVITCLSKVQEETGMRAKLILDSYLHARPQVAESVSDGAGTSVSAQES